MPITLDEMIRNAKNRLGEVPQGLKGEAASNPFLWETLAVRAVDQIARDTDCLLHVTYHVVACDGVYPVRGDVIPARGGPRYFYGNAAATALPVKMIGFRTPNRAWEIDAATGDALPLTGASVCPLPEWAISAVENRLALLRAKQFPGEYRDHIQLLQSDDDDLTGSAAAQASRVYELARKTY